MLRSTRLLLAVTACAALGTTGVLASSATARTTFHTGIYLSQKFPAFHGRVHSSNRFCKAHRPVKVFEQEPGKDKLMGTDTTAANGHWKIPVPKLASGIYFAKAPLYGSAALGIRCTAATSEIATVH